MNLGPLHLMRPEWLWALLPAILLGLLLWRQQRSSGSWTDVIAPELLQYLISGGPGEARRGLLPVLLLAWAVAAFAAAGPSWHQLPQPVHQKQDALVIVLDLSYSMKAADQPPSRLDRARQKLVDLLQLRREGQTGLIAYAGDAHVVTPLTDDTPTITNLLPALEPDMMPVPGSDAAAATEMAIELLRSAGIARGRILLVTDGLGNDDAETIAGLLRNSGTELSILGLGTRTGAPIPLPRGGFLKDSDGTIIMPTLDEGPLQRLAAATGGRYRALQVNQEDIDYLLAETPVLPGAERTLLLDRKADAWEDQGYWFALLLLPVVLVLFRRGWVACLLPLLIGLPEPASAQTWQDLWLTPDQQAERALRQGDAETAARLFEDRDWAGTAAYRAGDYESAIDKFSDNSSADGWYNRANALAKAGQLDEALAAYNRSLELAPDRDDARENKALIEQLKQQQEQQQQQEKEQQGGDSEQDKQQQEQQDSGQTGDQKQEQGQQQEGEDSGQEQQPDNSQGRGPDSPSDREQSAQEPESQPQQQAEENGQERSPTAQDEPRPEPEGEAADTGTQQAAADPRQQELEQAMEQWLRRVPDDPSGLLREKFRYESRQRQLQGDRRDDETFW